MSTKVIGAEGVAGARHYRRAGTALVGLALAAAIAILGIQARSIWSARPGTAVGRAPVETELLRPRGRNFSATLLNPPGSHRGQVRFGPLPSTTATATRPHGPKHRPKWGP